MIATQEGLASAGQTMRTHLAQTVPQLARTLAQISVLPVLETDLKEQVDLVQEAIDTQLHVCHLPPPLFSSLLPFVLLLTYC